MILAWRIQKVKPMDSSVLSTEYSVVSGLIVHPSSFIHDADLIRAKIPN
jgi:hypothetical protein